MRTLIIVPTPGAADRAGFRGPRRQHESDRDQKSVWVFSIEANPDHLREGQFDMVVVDSGCARFAYDKGDRMRDDFSRLLRFIRATCTHSDTIWIEP